MKKIKITAPCKSSCPDLEQHSTVERWVQRTALKIQINVQKSQCQSLKQAGYKHFFCRNTDTKLLKRIWLGEKKRIALFFAPLRLKWIKIKMDVIYWIIICWRSNFVMYSWRVIILKTRGKPFNLISYRLSSACLGSSRVFQASLSPVTLSNSSWGITRHSQVQMGYINPPVSSGLHQAGHAQKTSKPWTANKQQLYSELLTLFLRLRPHYGGLLSVTIGEGWNHRL